MSQQTTIDSLDTTRTALLLMDFHNGSVSYARTAVDGGLIGRAARARAIARGAAIQAVFIRVALDETDYRTIGRFNKTFAPYAVSHVLGEGDPSTDIVDELRPEPGDLVVTKKRFGAFSTSNLGMLLSPRVFDTLVLCGISTSGVVLSTVREAADRDYRVFVLSDCCGDPDTELHEVLMKRCFPVQADVLTTDEFATLVHTAKGKTLSATTQ
jgi:nicotinamidase-related amidase